MAESGRISGAQEPGEEDLLEALEHSLAGANPGAEEEDLLCALEQDLDTIHSVALPAGRKAARSGSGPAEPPDPGPIGYGLVHWPNEVRICVATFLSWAEFIGDSLLCRAWRRLGEEELLWRAYFRRAWPRLARRQAERAEGGLPWRALFRARWISKADRSEDALQEDWLDFSAAQDLGAGGVGPDRREAAAAQQEQRAAEFAEVDLRQALLQRREELFRVHDIWVPPHADRGHVCRSSCRFHRLAVAGDAFVCEASGNVHECKERVPCDFCILSSDDGFLVCPASGRCFPRHLDMNEEPPQDPAPAHNDWDPDLSMSQQFGRWFEQGYFMSEEQARHFFSNCGRRGRSLACGA